MKSGTTVIVSLPNVRYWEASINLVMFGRWTLRDAGVMDRTHLRWFTAATGAELVRGSGLSLQTMKGQMGGGRRFKLLNAITLTLLRDFLCPQYIYVAMKP